MVSTAPDVERLDADAIPGENEPPLRLGPEPNCEHPTKPRKYFYVPFEESLQDNLGVTPRSEPSSQSFQFLPQLRMIVDLAVENDDGIAGLASHRLIAAFQIDDF